MQTPFTLEQFLEVFRNYNQSVFPIQIVFYLLAGIALYLAFRPSSKSGKITSIVLAFFWLWMGIVYHFIFFTAINQAAYLFGTFFIIQGLLFLIFGVFRSDLSFRFHADTYGITGLILVVFALIIYPLTGNLFGHIYPATPTFGLPCPTTIFTFGFLLLNTKKCPLTILFIPFVWSVIGFMAVFQFGMLEDTSLFAAGLIATVLLIHRNRRSAENASDVKLEVLKNGGRKN